MPAHGPVATDGTVRSAAVCVGLSVATLVTAKATRDTLFLSAHSVRELPSLIAIGALTSLVSALAAAQAFKRFGPARALTPIFAISAALHAVELGMVSDSPELAAIVLYLHVAAFGATSLAGVWAAIGECFDPHRARRAVATIVIGGPIGGVAGGMLAFGLSQVGGVRAGLWTLVALPLVSAVMGRALVRSTRGRSTGTPQQKARKSNVSYLVEMALVVGLVAAASALMDYLVAARAVRSLGAGAALMAFFAGLHMAMGVVAFLLQSALARASLARLGIAGTVLTLPVATLLFCVGPLLTGALWAVAALRGVAGSLEGSLYRAGYELLYTPIPLAQKRAAKLLVDVGVDRVGTVAGAGLVALLLARGANEASLVLSVIAVSSCAIAVGVRLHRGYVTALEKSLESGAVALDATDVFDSATRRTMAETRSLDREKLLREIAEHYDKSVSEPPAPEQEAAPDLTSSFHDAGLGVPAAVQLANAAAASHDPTTEAWLVLREGHAREIRDVLRQLRPLPLELVPRVVHLLSRNDVARDAMAVLRREASRCIGVLVDMLLAPEIDVVVRRRLPRVLEREPEPRATHGLVRALFDDEMAVRTQAGLALLEQTRRFPEVVVPGDQVLDAVRRELDRADAAERAGQLGHDPTRWSDQERRRVQQGVEFSMIALALVLDREPLQLAYRALQGTDPVLRGTALEYFETILPEDIKRRSAVWLREVSPTTERRPQKQLLRALLESRGA